jgi:hypothetical protein
LTTTGKLRRIAAALGLLAAATVSAVTVAAQPAAADGTRIINGTTTCTSGIVPFAPWVNLGGGPGWPGAPGPGWLPADSSYQVPGTQTKVWTKVIPASTTSIALDVKCYLSMSEYYGYVTYPQGTWQNWVYSLTPGTSTINSTWSCTRQQVYPGPWIRTCARTAISYG